MFSPVKLLFIVCFILSQSKDIFSYLKTTVYSCYSCSRQEGAQFFSSSQLSTQANIRFPLKYTVSLVSVFLVDNPIIYLFSPVKLLFTVCFILSQSKNIFSYLKTTVYSCYSCSRQEGAQLFSSSQLSTQANIRFPLKYTVSLVSVFLVDNPIIYLFSPVKLLFTVCFILSQSKNIFSYLKTTVYSCYICSRQRRGSIFFIVSVVYTGKHQIPIIIHCLTRLSIFGR